MVILESNRRIKYTKSLSMPIIKELDKKIMKVNRDYKKYIGSREVETTDDDFGASRVDDKGQRYKTLYYLKNKLDPIEIPVYIARSNMDGKYFVGGGRYSRDIRDAMVWISTRNIPHSCTEILVFLVFDVVLVSDISDELTIGNNCYLDISRINEYTIPTILRVARKSDVDRLARRTEYSKFKLKEVDPKNELLKTDNLVLVFNLPKGYEVTLKIFGFKLFFDIHMNRYNNIYKAIEDALDWSLKNADIEVDCTCPDFKYRYAYVATQHDYKYGEKEDRPAKKTNPKNKGRACKHILAVLMRPSNYSRQLESRLVKILGNR